MSDYLQQTKEIYDFLTAVGATIPDRDLMAATLWMNYMVIANQGALLIARKLLLLDLQNLSMHFLCNRNHHYFIYQHTHLLLKITKIMVLNH